MASGRKRGLKLHSIIEKLSEQCERKSPLRDDEGEDVHLSSELCNVKRKQRKRNGVKRVFKEPSSRSDSEEGSSDEEIPVIQNEVQYNRDHKKESEEKASACHTIRRAMLYPRAAKTNAWRKQTIKQQQKSETRTLDNKNKKENKRRKGKSNINSSKVIEESSGKGADEDLAIDVEAFVHHGPVVEDIDQASASFPCPFCSALCRDNQDVTQHIKDCHDSECAVVDHSEQDEETSSDSPTDVTDSDEDFTPNKKTTPKQKGRHATKSQTSQNENAAAEVSEGELCIDVENVLGTESGVSDIDKPSANLMSTFLCVICNVHFKTKNDLTAHIPECSKQGSSKVSSSKFRCVCQACGMRFFQWTELRKHFDEKPDCRKMYQCDQCGQICLTTSFLRKHKRLHSDERPHKCSVCDAAFKDKAYLKRHGVKHTGIKEFKCDLCDKLFSHQRTLREHRRRHTGERPYKCKYCEATFINNSSLKTHTAKHTGILPYKCQACGKLFAKSYGLKMHSLSHSNEKPFVCEVCGKGFKRPDHFKQHKIIHSDDKPFKCDTCHRTFNQRVCLRKHLPCKEHERQEKKLQNSLAKQNRTQNKPKRSKKSSTNAPRKSENPEDISQADCPSPAVNDTTTDRCEVSNDFSLPSPVETSDNSLLAGCYSPPSFVRPMVKLEDNEYYSEHEDTHQDYHQHDRDFSPQHLTDRTETSLLPASFVPAMFGVEEPLSLDTLPPLPTHHTHSLSGRPLSHDNATDLGSVFLSSPMDSENLSSIVEETDSFF